MEKTSSASTTELHGNFLFRQSKYTDLDQLIEFNCRIHFFVPDCQQTISAMTADLLGGKYPQISEDAFSLVIDKSTKRIISAMALIPQTWSFGGITFGVGRPELVGTDPAYRGKGLVRYQFDSFHRRCSELGLGAQAITGIPYFYRQFGYELAISSGGGRMCFVPQQVASFPHQGHETYRITPAQLTDLKWIIPAYRAGCSRYLLSCSRDQETWEYEVAGRNERHIHRKEAWVIHASSNQPVGFFLSDSPAGNVNGKFAFWYELLPDSRWVDITPHVLRFLWERGQQDANSFGGDCASIGLELGEHHPAYQSVKHLLPNLMEPGTWYVRVPDLVKFIQSVIPVFQKRLDNSDMAGFDGELKISFYTNSICLNIKKGVIEQAVTYKPRDWQDADVAFPNLTFLQLLFGQRSFQDLKYAHADCWCTPAKEELVEALFPRMASQVWGLA